MSGAQSGVVKLATVVKNGVSPFSTLLSIDGAGVDPTFLVCFLQVNGCHPFISIRKQ